MARRGDWVPCQSFGEASELAGNDAVNIILVAPKDLNATGPAEVATIEEASACITLRVVGCVVISAPEGAFTGERIRTGILDNAGANAFYANSFEDGPDANEPFLWQRYQSIGAGQNTVAGAGGVHPYWSLIDVRVSRRLESGTALFYSVATLSTGTAFVQPFLRTYARSLG